ncbi:MAG: hypothetical protein AB7F31_04340 [Parachlamydiales bacterium]
MPVQVRDVGYGKFQKVAAKVKGAAAEADGRLTEYKLCAAAAILLHLGGGRLLSNGLRALDSVRIIRASYLTIGALLLQGIAHARLRWAQDRAESASKKLRERFAKELKGSTTKGVSENLPEHGAHLFGEYGSLAPIGLKYAQGSVSANFKLLAKRGAALKGERERYLLLGRVAMGVGVGSLLMIAVLLWRRWGLTVALPTALGTTFASAAAGAYFSGIRAWRGWEEKGIAESLARGIKGCNGEGVDWKLVGPHLKRLSLVGKEAPLAELQSLKTLSLKNSVLSEVTLPPKTKRLTLLTLPQKVEGLKTVQSLHLQLVTGEAMKRVVQLPITELSIDNATPHTDLLTLPEKLESLSLPTFPSPHGENPLSRCQYLTKVTMATWGVGADEALKGLSVLKELKVKDGKRLLFREIEWITGHHEIKKVKIGNFKAALLRLEHLEELDKTFLVYVKGKSDPLEQKELGKALTAERVTFDARY